MAGQQNECNEKLIEQVSRLLQRYWIWEWNVR